MGEKALGKKSKRIDTSAEQEGLTDNPFVSLGDMISGEELPDGVPAPELVKAEILYKRQHPYSVGRTRKGGWPVSKERRAAGKVVTLVGHVSGDTKALLKELQKALGAGGKIDGDAIQLQGDHVETVLQFLDEAFRN
ncbi:MAG TPA: hypothetical protein EYN96_10950 [Candidatus Hydrogenedentes bacterium]|nr:hypothetical protein [Candidatus Hydrogenedentota bacterium]